MSKCRRKTKATNGKGKYTAAIVLTIGSSFTKPKSEAVNDSTIIISSGEHISF